MKSAMIQYLYLGRVSYDEALRLQAELVDLRYQGRIENTLLLLPPLAVQILVPARSVPTTRIRLS